MSRLVIFLLAIATLAACSGNALQIRNEPPPADAQARAGTHEGTMAGAGGTVKGM